MARLWYTRARCWEVAVNVTHLHSHEGRRFILSPALCLYSLSSTACRIPVKKKGKFAHAMRIVCPMNTSPSMSDSEARCR
jgi:hypothetical protein